MSTEKVFAEAKGTRPLEAEEIQTIGIEASTEAQKMMLEKFSRVAFDGNEITVLMNLAALMMVHSVISSLKYMEDYEALDGFRNCLRDAADRED